MAPILDTSTCGNIKSVLKPPPEMESLDKVTPESEKNSLKSAHKKVKKAVNKLKLALIKPNAKE